MTGSTTGNIGALGGGIGRDAGENGKAREAGKAGEARDAEGGREKNRAYVASASGREPPSQSDHTSTTTTTTTMVTVTVTTTTVVCGRVRSVWWRVCRGRRGELSWSSYTRTMSVP
jgi:hypothetical protein